MSATPEVYQNLGQMIRDRARISPEKVALVCWDGTLRYGELDSRSDQLAVGLLESGIGAGDRVATLTSNRTEFVALWFAVAKLGAVLVPLNTALRGELLAYELEDCQPKGLLVEQTYLSAFTAVRAGLPAIPAWVVGESPSGPGTVPFDSLRSARRSLPELSVEPWQPAEIIYTSGTTDRPKGVVLPHRRLLNTPREIGGRARLDAGSVLFSALPLFHCNAQEKTVLVALLHGLTAVIADRFRASTFWDQAAASGATHVSLLTSMISILYKQPPTDRDRTHGVRIATASGTPADLWADFQERFGISIVESYGMTECGCTTIMNPPSAPRVGSVGTPLGFVEAQVVDDWDRPVPPGTPGELLVRPREPFTMFLEYYRKPEKTVEAWRNLWFHTGDLMKQDADGYFYFLDRKKDVIRRRGENIAPYDVENVLNQHPSVFESVVVGVPAEVGEEDVKAFIQLKPGLRVDPEELFRFAADRLPAFMVPRYLEFIEDIPRTSNQKAQRRLLKGKRSEAEVERPAYR